MNVSPIPLMIAPSTDIDNRLLLHQEITDLMISSALHYRVYPNIYQTQFIDHSCHRDFVWRRGLVKIYLERNIYLKNVGHSILEGFVLQQLKIEGKLHKKDIRKCAGDVLFNFGEQFDNRLVSTTPFTYFFTQRNVELIDVEVSIWELIYLSLSFNSSRRKSYGNNPITSFDEIKSTLLDKRKDRLKLMETALRKCDHSLCSDFISGREQYLPDMKKKMNNAIRKEKKFRHYKGFGGEPTGFRVRKREVNFFQYLFERTHDDITQIGELKKSLSKRKINYSLYRQAGPEQFDLIAEIRDRQFTIIGPLEKFLIIPEEDELDKIGDQVITDELLTSGIIPLEQRGIYGKWRHHTIREAVRLNLINLERPIHAEFKIIKDVFLDLITMYYSIALEFPEKGCHDADSRKLIDESRFFERSLRRIRNLHVLNPPAYRELQSRTRSSSRFELLANAMLNFYFGYKEIDQVQISLESARDVLVIAKIISQVFSMVNYSSQFGAAPFMLRKQLCAVSPDLSTAEVHTKSFLPSRFTKIEYLSNPNHWIDEEIGNQSRIDIELQIRIRTLSERLSENILFCIRGNSGVGKSFYINEFVNEHFKERSLILSDGVLNPDQIKFDLKNTGAITLRNQQVLLEAKVIWERLLDMLEKPSSQIHSAIIDTRLLETVHLKRFLRISEVMNAKLQIVDIDAPIWNSIFSVLGRDANGKDPCVSYEVIKNGFRDARKYRREFMEICLESGVAYKLIHVSQLEERTVVCEISNGKIERFEQALYDKCLTELDEREFDVGNVSLKALVEEHEYLGKMIDSEKFNMNMTVVDALNSKESFSPLLIQGQNK